MPLPINTEGCSPVGEKVPFRALAYPSAFLHQRIVSALLHQAQSNSFGMNGSGQKDFSLSPRPRKVGNKIIQPIHIFPYEWRILL